MEEVSKIMISGYYGFGNLGDEAILAALLRKLGDRFPQAELVVLSHNPKLTERQHYVRTISRWNLWKIWRELKGVKLFISGGGGLLQNVTSRRSPFYYLGLIQMAQLRGVPVFIVGQGIGPLRGWFTKRTAAASLRGAEYIMVRDRASLAIIEEWGIDQRQLLSGYDLALSLTGAIEEVQPQEVQSQGGSRILSVALKEVAQERKRFIKSMAAGLDEVCRRFSLKAVFIPTYPKEDLKIAEEVRKEMNEVQPTQTLLIDTTDLSVEQMIHLIGQSKLLIGARLHALEFALITGVPFACLSYDPKIDEFIQQVEVKPLCQMTGLKIPLWTEGEITPDQIVKGLEQLWHEREVYQNKLSECAEQLSKLADESLEKVCQRMTEHLAQPAKAGFE